MAAGPAPGLGCCPHPRIPAPAQGRLRSHTDPGPSVASRSPLVLGGSGPPSRCSCAQVTADHPGARPTVGRARRDWERLAFAQPGAPAPLWREPISQSAVLAASVGSSLPGQPRRRQNSSRAFSLHVPYSDRQEKVQRKAGLAVGTSAGSLPPPTDANITEA